MVPASLSRQGLLQTWCPAPLKTAGQWAAGWSLALQAHALGLEVALLLEGRFTSLSLFLSLQRSDLRAACPTSPGNRPPAVEAQ